MPFQSRAFNVARPRFGESGMKPDVTSTQGPNVIAPGSVLFIRLGWGKTKVLIFISIETEISKFCFKIVSSSSLESKNVKLRFDNSKTNFIAEVEIEQAWPRAILKRLLNAA